MDPDLGFDKRIRNAKLFWKFVLCAAAPPSGPARGGTAPLPLLLSQLRRQCGQ